MTVTAFRLFGGDRRGATGYTRAADFPITPGAYRTTIERFEDGFVMKLNPMDGSIVYSTYIPGNYSVDIQTADLTNGTYLVRMVANSKVYTMKLNVSR